MPDKPSKAADIRLLLTKRMKPAAIARCVPCSLGYAYKIAASEAKKAAAAQSGAAPKKPAGRSRAVEAPRREDAIDERTARALGIW